MVVKINRIDRPMVVCYPPDDVPMVEDPDDPGVMIPDETWLITQDDEPVDGKYTEKEMRLLTYPLYAYWKAPVKEFAAMANVGLFFSSTEPPIVPDIMLSMNVKEPTPIKGRMVQSYFLWRYKKLPEVVIEVVSNRKGGEDTRKLKDYARIGVRYYVIFDPEEILSNEILRVYRLRGGRYQLTKKHFFPEVGLGLVLWAGKYEKREADRWLRWCDEKGQLIPTGEEYAAAARSRMKRDKQRLNLEKQRAEQEKQRADKLAARLRAHGIGANGD